MRFENLNFPKSKMYNALICKDIRNKAIISFCYIYCAVTAAIDILESEIITKLIKGEQIKFDYEDIISIISIVLNVIAIFYFLVFGSKIDSRF